jgi:predicted MFS family arabinose efflux permease
VLGLLPPETTPDARVLLSTRALRAFVDGLVSTLLASYLLLLGYGARKVGFIVTGTMLGSAALTLFVGLRGHRIARRRLLMVVACLMIVTGLAFSVVTAFWGVFAIAVIGTMNPSSGDVSVFLPTEQALLPSTVSDRQRTAMYGRYSLVGFLFAAFGALAAGLPDAIAARGWMTTAAADRLAFVLYALAGVVILVLYRQLSPAIEPPGDRRRAALGASRRIVYRLAALFSVDSLGGGFVVQSLIALWLYRRFNLSVTTAGLIFFWSGLLSGLSALVSVKLAKRIGLVRTMVFTHLPANGFLIAAAFMPNVWLAVGCLLIRSALSQMDVPARTSFVMAVVTPEERPAAASVTNVPRSLASALAPSAAGWMLEHSKFGWPLVIGGVLKALYDLLLLALFRNVRPPEEQI